MGLFDSYSGSNNNRDFVGAFVTFAEAAKTAAEAYAKKNAQPTIVVNVSYEPGTNTIIDVANAVKRAVQVQDR
jgi:multidrug efflux pump subunit AcrB